jgi:Ca-activated chloride channel homolog
MVAKRGLAACLLLCVCGFFAANWAPPAQGQTEMPAAKAPVIITTKVEVVEVPVIIFDDKGAVATGLKKSDFRLLDDGVPQKILNFERERVPVSFVLVADLSSSMTGKIPFVQEAALSLIDPEDEDGGYDEYSVLGIGKRSKQLMPFTTDQADLEYRLPLLLTPTKESTSLFDGLWLGVATARHEAANKHRAMIVLTDGGDNHSRYSLGETKRLLEEADLPVFAVMAEPSYPLEEFFARREKKRAPFPMGIPDGLSGPMGIDRGDYIGPAERRGPYNMKTLADASGGGVFTARDDSDLPRIVRTIGLAVRYRYVLSYEPERSEAAKQNRERNTAEHSTHKIRLELYPKEKFAHYSVPYYKRTYRSFE